MRHITSFAVLLALACAACACRTTREPQRHDTAAPPGQKAATTMSERCGDLSFSLIAGFTLKDDRVEKRTVTNIPDAPPTTEHFRSYEDRAGHGLYFYWWDGWPADYGPMAASEQWKTAVGGEPATVSLTRVFFGAQKRVLVAHFAGPPPQRHRYLIYTTLIDRAAFATLLDSASFGGAATSAAVPGAHDAFLAARRQLDRACVLQAKGDHAATNAAAQQGIATLGKDYAPPHVVDDTSLKLAAADDLAQGGSAADAAALRIRVLRIRLRLYERRHPAAPRDDRALALQLRIAPTSSRVGEDVVAAVTLRCTGSAPVVLNTRMAVNSEHAPDPFRELVFEVTGPNGVRRPFLSRVRIGFPRAEHVRPLSPGEHVEDVVRLSRYFDLGQPGKYEVRAFYSSTPVADAAGRPAWTEQVASELVSLTRTR